MRDTLYNLIRNNRNNTTQKISIGITEHFSKRREVLNDKDLVDSSTGITHRRGTISILTNERVYVINITKVMFLLYTLDQVSGNY